MNNMIKCLFLSVSMAFASVAFAAPVGSCMQAAKTLASSQGVTLVNEYDPEWGEYFDMGTFYYKVKLLKGQSYTIWINGGNTTDMFLWAETDLNDENAPFAMFESVERDNGATKIMYLYADSWSEDDPSSGIYYVNISGDIGQTCNLYFQQGIKTFTVVGEESNPKRITMTDVATKDTVNLIDGSYYYTATLSAGRKYSIRTVGGTAAAPLSLNIEGDFTYEIDSAFSNDVNNVSYLVYPEVTEDFVISIASASATSASLKFWSYPERLPEDHDWVAFAKQADNTYQASGVPGRVVQDSASAGRSYYDAVIDEFLAKIPLEAGTRWVFETSGATSPLDIRIYDGAGKILATNLTMGNGTNDVRVATAIESKGNYYVGVCVRLPYLEYWESAPTAPLITITARNADDFTDPEDSDQDDPEDDVWAGASLVNPLPGVSGDSVISVGGVSEEHVLSGGDWYDWFAIPCRKGVTYSIKADFATEKTTDLALFGKIYTATNGTIARVADYKGSLDPNSSSMPLTFTAIQNGMHYVRVNVAEGIGLDYPSYKVYVMATSASPLGLIQGVTQGIAATWYLTDDATALYQSGAIVATPNLAPNVRFSAVSGYTTPGKQAAALTEWSVSSNVTVVVGRYVDSADPADDLSSGFMAISPIAKPTTVGRTLWTDDAADWFRFTAVDGRYYNFKLVDTTDGEVGDAIFSIIRSSDGKTVVAGLPEVNRIAFTAGYHFVKVVHSGSDAKDSTYNLIHSSVNIGTISFAATTVAVSETNATADVILKRSANEGKVSIMYATEALNAQPGKEYYPATGMVTWEDGDKADKTISVRLIPDLIPTFDEQKKFKVVIWTLPEDTLKDDEYPAQISGPTFATVKIRESSAAAPGTIVMSSPADRTVRGGETLKAVFSRVGGSDGSLAVKVKAQTSTAIAGATDGDGSDFKYVKQIITWADGDTEDKVVEVPTWATDWTGDPRQLRLKLSTLATGDYAGNLTPALAEAKIYVTIENALQPGTIVMKSPDPREVLAGETLKAVFSRVGGSSGSLAVKVKAQSSTAIAGATDGDGSDFKYVKQIITWADGDTEDKVVEVPTWTCKNWGESKQLRFKLSTLATGDYAGNLTPKLSEAKIYVKILNRLTASGVSGGPVVKIASGTDAYGNAITDGAPIKLVQGLYATVNMGDVNKATVSAAVIAGALPTGMVVKNNRLYGVPAVAGPFSALVQVSAAGKKGTSMWLDFEVASAGTSLGSFYGVLSEDGTALTNAVARIGSISYTTTADGSHTAKVKVGTSTYTFSKTTGYTLVDSWDMATETRILSDRLTQVVMVGDVPYTNVLSLTVTDVAVTNYATLGQVEVSAELDMNVLDADGTGIQTDISYKGTLVRNNSDIALFSELMKTYVGYYTVSLVPEGVCATDGVPCGNGYLTMTVAEDGAVKAAGMLSDGTEVSCSSRATLVGDWTDASSCALIIPVMSKVSPYSFGGIVSLSLRAGEVVVDSRVALDWTKDGVTSSYDQNGFLLTLRPTGGWYDTVYNLQAYYLDFDLTVETEALDSLPANLLPSGYGFTAQTTPYAVEALLTGDTLAAVSRKLVLEDGSTSRYDLKKSDNPWKVKVALNHATGIVTGTFKPWFDDGMTQTAPLTYSHNGVLLMCRDAYSPLDMDVWSAGFYKVPVNSDWSMSLPLNIRATKIDRDWSEMEAP